MSTHPENIIQDTARGGFAAALTQSEQQSRRLAALAGTAGQHRPKPPFPIWTSEAARGWRDRGSHEPLDSDVSQHPAQQQVVGVTRLESIAEDPRGHSLHEPQLFERHQENIVKSNLKKHSDLFEEYNKHHDTIHKLKTTLIDNKQEFEEKNHQLREELRKAIIHLNLLYSRGLEMEKRFQFLPNTFKHLHHEKHVQNDDFHHASQPSHVPQIHEQSKSHNTLSNSVNSHNENHSFWTYLDPTHWLKHFNTSNTRAEVGADFAFGLLPSDSTPAEKRKCLRTRRVGAQPESSRATPRPRGTSTATHTRRDRRPRASPSC